MAAFFLFFISQSILSDDTTKASTTPVQATITTEIPDALIHHTRSEKKLSNYADRYNSPLKSASMYSVNDSTHVGIITFQITRKDVESLNKKLKSTIKKIGE